MVKEICEQYWTINYAIPLGKGVIPFRENNMMVMMNFRKINFPEIIFFLRWLILGLAYKS